MELGQFIEMYSLMQMGVKVDITELTHYDAKMLLFVATEIQHKQQRDMKMQAMRNRR